MIEVIACSVEDAIAAASGGADRLEIVSHLEVGGLTPSLALVQGIQAAVRLPLRIMLREEESFFVADAKKIERLCEVARSFADLSVDGLVLGFLTRNGSEVSIAHEVIEPVLAAAPQTRVTFHRAFEEVTNPQATVAELKKYTQIDCILTSHGGRPLGQTDGGPPPWSALCSTKMTDRFNGLAELAAVAAPEINILMGGGLTAEMIESLCQDLQNRQRLTQIHLGQAVRAEHSINGVVRVELVQPLVAKWKQAA